MKTRQTEIEKECCHVLYHRRFKVLHRRLHKNRWHLFSKITSARCTIPEERSVGSDEVHVWSTDISVSFLSNDHTWRGRKRDLASCGLTDADLGDIKTCLTAAGRSSMVAL